MQRPAWLSIAVRVCLAVGLLATPADAQKPAVEYHDTSAIPLAPYNAMQARAVLADTSGWAYAEIPAGMKQVANHHDQEQLTVNLAGTFDILIGGTTHTLKERAALVPGNVEHPITVGDQPAIFMEFQGVVRTDWLPPHTRMALPQSPEALTVPAGQQVTLDFSLASDGWRTETSGARWKSITGKTIRGTFWDLSKSGASVNMTTTPSARERLVYVLNGRLTSRAGGESRDIAKQMLLVVRPSATNLHLVSAGQANTLVLVFESI